MSFLGVCWLEGAAQPFVVRTDHKNLAYLRGTIRLNSHQARWVLFLSCFKFALTYRPGSKNNKPKALSRQFATDQPDPEPEPILPPSCIVGAATWQVEERVREALRSAPDPGGAPANTLFVPNSARSKVLQWGYASKLACHPGLILTLHFV